MKGLNIAAACGLSDDAQSRRFGVGDRVRVANNSRGYAAYYLQPGSPGTVAEIVNPGDPAALVCYGIWMDEGCRTPLDDPGGWAFMGNELEPEEPRA